MSDEGQPLKPEHIFKQVAWRSMFGISESMEQWTTWSITGIAAIVALFIGNLDSVGKLVSREGLRWSLICFTASLVLGALSKQLGIAIVNGVAMIEKLEGRLSSEQLKAVINQMSTPLPQLMDEIAEPFWWPLSTILRKAGRKGMTDYLSSDKRFIPLFCLQMLLVNLHGLFAAIGLVVIAATIVT
jgi:hypothetical protein